MANDIEAALIEAYIAWRDRLGSLACDRDEAGFRAGYRAALAALITTADAVPVAWAIIYEDASVPPQLFVGVGAEKAALARFEDARLTWACHLMRSAAPASGAVEEARKVVEAAKRWRDMDDENDDSGCVALSDAVDALLAAERADRGGKGA